MELVPSGLRVGLDFGLGAEGSLNAGLGVPCAYLEAACGLINEATIVETELGSWQSYLELLITSRTPKTLYIPMCLCQTLVL